MLHAPFLYFPFLQFGHQFIQLFLVDVIEAGLGLDLFGILRAFQHGIDKICGSFFRNEFVGFVHGKKGKFSSI